MDMKTVKQYRNLILVVMGISFVITMIGLVTMISTRGDDWFSVIMTKIGIVGVIAAYFLSLYVAVKRRKQVAKPTKVLLWVLIALSAPILYGLVTLLFVM